MRKVLREFTAIRRQKKPHTALVYVLLPDAYYSEYLIGKDEVSFGRN